MSFLATHILTKPVVSTVSAETIATVDDLVYELSRWGVTGFEVLTDGGKFVLPVNGVESAAENQILVKDKDSLVPHEDAPELTAELMRGPKLQDVEVQTATGEKLGYLEDIEITPQDWSIISLMVGRGEVSNALLGPVQLTPGDVVVKSPTLIQIRPEVNIDLGGEAEQAVADVVQKVGDNANDLLQKGRNIINDIIK